MRLERSITSLLAVFAVACDQAPVPGPATPDPRAPTVLPPPSDTPTAGPALQIAQATVSSSTADFAATLPGDVIVLQAGADVMLSPAPGVAPVNIGAVTGALRAVTALEWGRILLYGDEGFFVYDNGVVAESALSMAFDGEAGQQVQGMLSAPGPSGAFDLWFALADSLHIWREGQSSSLQPTGLPVANAKLAYGAPIDGVPALWVASGDAVYGLIWRDDRFVAQQALADTVVDAMVVDFEGTLWIATQGKLRSRDWGGAWYDHPLVTGVRDLAGHQDAADLWIVTADDGLWHHRAGVFRPVPGAPSATRILAASGGSAIVLNDAGVVRLIPGGAIEIVGITPGGLLTEAVSVEIRPFNAAQVTLLSASLDGAPLEVVEPPTDEARYFVTALDPEPLATGTHQLEVLVEYGDGTPSARAKVRFSVLKTTPPTWSTDIEPLHHDNCSVCHGVRGSAQPLDSPELWQASIELVILNAREGTMPLPPNPPLTREQVDLIELWRAAGYPE